MEAIIAVLVTVLVVAAVGAIVGRGRRRRRVAVMASRPVTRGEAAAGADNTDDITSVDSPGDGGDQ